uniref:At1g61320/AtMIF1 LRR domain-containing protein n=1 Tax=Chenopodium quinoa TaxID=63459 RepID=A0A803LAR5_CHEQI
MKLGQPMQHPPGRLSTLHHPPGLTGRSVESDEELDMLSSKSVCIVKLVDVDHNDHLSVAYELVELQPHAQCEQAVQTCVLSHRWMCLWKYVPKLNFEDSRAMDRIKDSMSKDEIVDSERCCFISFVNRVLEQPLGDIDEMRIKFDLDNLCKFDIDKWLLENLCLECSEILTSVSSASLSLPLKHLNVSCCFNMQTIDISAPKLLSLTYFGDPIEFNIRNASSLLELSVGGDKLIKVAYAFEPLAIYLSQLKYLQLRMRLHNGNNLAIEHPPAFPSLKHLELYAVADFNESSWDGSL